MYSNHPNTGHHSKTGHFCPVFKWFGSRDTKIMVDHLKNGPFVNQTHLDQLKTGLVRYSDGFCTCDLTF